MVVKVFIIPQEDGKNTVIVRRTLPREYPSHSVADVTDAELEATVARMVELVRHGTEESPA